MILNDYLDLIGVKNINIPSFRFLKELQNRHLLSIPFENLDIHQNKKIILENDIISEKIIRQKRGGYCYELNSLFGRLLISLGYKINMVSAKVYNKEQNSYGQEFDHLTILVHLDKLYLVDVGFGDACREPIAIPGGKVSDISGEYRIEKGPPGIFILAKFDGERFIPQYRFTLIPREFSEFKEMNDYHQTSPLSSFTKGNLTTLATETGRVTLTDTSLIITDGSNKKKIGINSKKEFYKNLENYFSIKLK